MAKNKKITPIDEKEVTEVLVDFTPIDEKEVTEVLVDFTPIDEKEVVTIILFSSSRMVKQDTEKKVSGNVANILIKKGFAKIK